MFHILRRHMTELASSAGYLILLIIGFEINSPDAWPYVFSAIMVLSMIAWVLSYKRARLIADLPTSRISSAAQGYAEIYGRAVLSTDHLLRSPFSGLSCVWYRYRVSVREDDKWRQITDITSQDTIEVVDGSGRCFVDPDHAEIIGAERRVKVLSNHKHEEELLFAAPIYVLGDFHTLGGSTHLLNVNEDVKALLAQWKREQTTLIARFDLDKNGEIDMQEWELARRAATREVEKQHREIRAHPDVHVMRVPKDQRPYIISGYSPQRIRRQYLIWSYVHILILISATGAYLVLW